MPVEVVAEPLPDFGVAFVIGILERFDHLGVARGTADIFGRATSGGLDQSGICIVRFGIRYPFDLDRVLPAVAEVIEIARRLGSGVFERDDEPSFAGVERSVGSIGIGKTPARVPRADFKEIAICPA